MEWISINDGIPPKNDVYLVCEDSLLEKGKKVISTMYFDIKFGFIDNYSEEPTNTVTHWMSTPKPPKED